MIADQKLYDAVEDLNNIKCNITLAQLLDDSPKVETKVIQSLKLEKRSVGALHFFFFLKSFYFDIKWT